MSQSYIVEYRDEAVGLVKRDAENGPFVFFACDRRVGALEGQRFATPRAAELAAGRMLAQPEPRLHWQAAGHPER